MLESRANGYNAREPLKADARDLTGGQPTPEAPRTIFDLLGTVQKLPWHLQARGEFEYVGAKPPGTGCDPNNPSAECTGVPVKEFCAAVVRPFLSGRMDAGVNMLIASGYTGQTTENFHPPDRHTRDRHTGSGGGSHTLVCQRHPYLSVWTLAPPGLDASPARRLRAAKSRYRSGKWAGAMRCAGICQIGKSDAPSITLKEILCTTLLQ